MSRQSRQAELRKRMAEARSKLQISASSSAAVDEQQQHETNPPSAASSILRKSKYTAKASVKADGGNALSSLIGGYSSSSEDESKSVAAKKREAPVSSADNIEVKKRAKFSTDVHVRAITSDEDVDSNQGRIIASKNNITEDSKPTPKENISNEVWDEFKALLEDDDIPVGEDEIEKQTPTSKPEPTKTTPSNPEPTKKKKKKKKQSTDKSYDSEAVTNVEQASYEARLARLVLLKNKKTDNGVLDSVDFYDPGLAFQQDDDDDDDGDEGRDQTPNDGGDDHNETSIQTNSNVDASSQASIAEILRKRRKEARQLSAPADDGDEKDLDLADGCWF